MPMKTVAVVPIGEYSSRVRALFRDREPADDELGELLGEIMYAAVASAMRAVPGFLMADVRVDPCPCEACEAARRRPS